MRRRGATSAEDALLQIRRARRYNLSWRQLRAGVRLAPRKQLGSAIRAVRNVMLGRGGTRGRGGESDRGFLKCFALRTNAVYLANQQVIELADGSKRSAATALLMDVIKAQLDYAECSGRLRIQSHPHPLSWLATTNGDVKETSPGHHRTGRDAALARDRDAV